jgi:hypothetical protein
MDHGLRRDGDAKPDYPAILPNSGVGLSGR